MRISDWSSDVCSSDLGNYIPNVRRNTGKVGDTVVLLALMDVLAVPNVCGSGDVSNTSNFWFHPVGIEAREATDETRRIVATLREKHTGYVTDRKSVVSGKSVSVRVDRGGRSQLKKKQKT